MLIFDARFPDHLPVVQALFRAYEEDQAGSACAAVCFAEFNRELASLPGPYAAPAGGVWLAAAEGQPAGCVALRRQADGVAEMKRLFVQPAFRGRGIGEALVRRLVDGARARGYGRIRLETLPSMRGAIRLYARFGFTDIAPYAGTAASDLRAMELDLARGSAPVFES